MDGAGKKQLMDRKRINILYQKQLFSFTHGIATLQVSKSVKFIRFLYRKMKGGISVTHGYARCSTNEDRQDINRQTRELKKQGVEKIWLEFEHGDTASKEQQRLMLDAVNPGDTILTLELSMIRERVRSGVENARAKGKQLGRPPVSEASIPDSFYRYYKRYNNIIS